MFDIVELVRELNKMDKNKLGQVIVVLALMCFFKAIPLLWSGLLLIQVK